MAFKYLNPLSAPWSNSGLKYLLMPEGWQQEQATPKSVEPQKTDFQNKIQPAPKSQLKKTPFQNQQPTQPVPEIKQKHFQTIPLEDWPEHWRKQLNKSKKGSIAWTYWNLGYDILNAKSTTDTAEKEKIDLRRALINRILGDLNHPHGTHTFWPPFLPQSGANPTAQDVDLFWSGISHLGCRGVAIMGSETAKALLPKVNLRPLEMLVIHGFFVWILRDIDALIKSEEHYVKMRAYLQQQLARFAR